MLFDFQEEYSFNFQFILVFKDLNEFKQLNIYQALEFTKIFEVSFFYHSLKLFMFARARDFYIQEVIHGLFIIYILFFFVLRLKF
jgi:hypothetical protein